MLAGRLRERLAALPQVTVLDLPTCSQSAIVAFQLNSMPADEVRSRLAERAVNVSRALASDSPLLVLPGRPREWLRVSPHYFNTETELDEFAEILGSARFPRNVNASG